MLSSFLATRSGLSKPSSCTMMLNVDVQDTNYIPVSLSDITLSNNANCLYWPAKVCSNKLVEEPTAGGTLSLAKATIEEQDYMLVSLEAVL